MVFLIQWFDNAFYYQYCIVSNTLTFDILKPHLEDKRVFVINYNVKKKRNASYQKNTFLPRKTNLQGI